MTAPAVNGAVGTILERNKHMDIYPDWLTAVHHDGSLHYVSPTYPRLGEKVRLRLRVGHAPKGLRLFVRIFPDGEQSFLPMTAVTNPGEDISWYEANLPIREPITHYRFLLEAPDGVWQYTAAGPIHYDPLDQTDFRIVADYAAPDWLATAVCYQIFPDRFANGDPTTDPQPHEFEYRGQRPQTLPWEAEPDPDLFFPLVFYGGDLPGIQQRLDYLQALGVNTLYLNPIFTAYSNHKYDVADYEQVDPHFGGNEALIGLRQALTARGMRYLLDIVPNHCGYWHPWFVRARQDAHAPEAEFFTFNQHPDDYASWLGVWTLPKLNYRSAELRRRIYEDETAVFRRWLQPPFSADGWRVDVANMLGRQGETQIGEAIAQGIRQAVKESRADAYLMGENFFDASAQLQGDQWDGVMNYSGFTKPLWHWLRGYEQGAHGLGTTIRSAQKWPTAALIDAWRSRLAAIPWQIALQQYNLVGSHDVPRLDTVVNGNEALHRLAAVVQFAYPGVPGLYYGDEIGLTDKSLLGPRGCMIWDESRWNQERLAFYKKLIAFRQQSAALQTGGLQILAVEEDGFIFQREGSDGRVLVLAHRGETERPASELAAVPAGIANGARFRELFSGQEIAVSHGRLPLPAQLQGATLWYEMG
jgi:alpha-glucosidase